LQFPNTVSLFSATAISILPISNYITVSECCLIKLLPYVLFEKHIYILALEMASLGNQHCVGTLSFHIVLSCVGLQLFLFPVKKGKVFPYSLPSVGPGADPGVQAVSPQVT